MNWRKRFGVEMVAVVVMVVGVSVLAVYQYRWTGEISRTEQERLRNSLSTSVRNFDQEFSYDFQQLCESFELDPQPERSAIESLVELQQAKWNRTSTHPEFVAGVYISKTSAENVATLEAADRNGGHFHAVNWPENLQSLREALARRAESSRSEPIADREAVYYPWTFYADGPALARPIFQTTSEGNDRIGEVRATGFLVVVLNPEYLARIYFPELVERHFGGPGQRSFVVAIRTAHAPYRTEYISDSNFANSSAPSDAAVNLFDLVGEEARRRDHPPLQASAAGEQWQLVAQHPSGSLELAVASWRRRNLAISLGLLACLAGSMALILSAARRSKTLAKMQMEFVAGVSHELCTPLAVINTAAENLADGVVENPEQMREYGGLIRGQGRRLERLVDEVLLFTAGRFGLSGYQLELVDVAPIVAQSMSASEAGLRESGFTVAQEIGAGLPSVLADPSAIITCIENLVSNAAKYSNSTRSMMIRAYVASSDSKAEVRISVEDHGIGISSLDLAHIFEPFYRVQAVRDNQIRGVGLGLYLVKRMMEDMGGRVSVSSELGRGTAVVLHFPVPGEPAPDGKN